MPYKILISHGSFFEDDYMRGVSFSDGNVAPTHFIIFSKSKLEDEQDKGLGMDKVHIQIGDQSRATYGGVEKVETLEESVQVYIDSVGSKKLEVDGLISLVFTEVTEEIKNAVDALTSMMRSDNITIFRIPPSV
ncbi:MAG TPA: hypothetical protein EYP39_03925 [Ghiorsea sp.]|nr:hypothetical protein [Ghiorsea sp.]